MDADDADVKDPLAGSEVQDPPVDLVVDPDGDEREERIRNGFSCL